MDAPQSGGAILTWALALQNPPATPDQFLLYALADDTDEGAQKVEADLSAAKPNEFVRVPVRFTNMVDTTNVYIQPHKWGLWCVIRRAVHPNEFIRGS